MYRQFVILLGEMKVLIFLSLLSLAAGKKWLQESDNLAQYLELAKNSLSILDRIQTRTYDNYSTMSPTCLAAIEAMANAAQKGEPWALALFDSWGERQSGYFSGDNTWEGHYDQCTEGAFGVVGYYCIVEWNSAAFLPFGIEFTRDGKALCMPKVCTSEEVHLFFKQGASSGEITLPVAGELHINESMIYCPRTMDERREDMVKDPSAMACISVLGFFVLLAIIGTLYHVITHYQEEHRNKKENTLSTDHIEMIGNYGNGTAANGREFSSRDVLQPSKPKPWKHNTCGKLLLCFSVWRHAPQIMNFRQPRGSIECLHGVRFLAFCWILLGHTGELGIIINPTSNTGANWFRYFEFKSRPLHAVMNEMNISVETFFILSGALTAISFLKKLEKKKPDCEMMGLYYFHRFWRLTPVYMFILMFYATMPQYLSGSPFNRPHPDSTNCKKHWWSNLLYLNNFLHLEDESGPQDCMGWTWYLACDFQFYVIAPVFLFPLFYIPPLGITLNILAIAGGLISRGVIFNDLLVNNKQVSFFWDIYVKPWTRCSTYFLALIFGYILWKTKLKAKIHPALITLGWILGLAAICVAVFLKINSSEWSPRGMVAFETLQRPLFTLGVMWIIFACATGNGGFVGMILSWNGWLPLARLSYVCYLSHNILLFFHVGQQPFQVYHTDWNTTIYWFLSHLVLVIGFSFMISLLLEVPFASLEKVMFQNLHKNKARDAEVKPVPVPALTQQESELTKPVEKFTPGRFTTKDYNNYPAQYDNKAHVISKRSDLDYIPPPDYENNWRLTSAKL